MEEEKITIIEGPPPTFEQVNEGWAIGLNEGPYLYDTVATRLRTFNGPALVERCHRAWRNQKNIFLHFKDTLGVEEKVPILAARNMDTSDGQVLVLWVRIKPGETEYEMDYDDEDDEYDL